MSKKVLIVDDDSNFCCGIMSRYSEGDISFSMADTLSIARGMVRDGHFDFVLANVKIPGGESTKLRDDVASLSPQTKIIFMSGLESDYKILSSRGEKCILKQNINNNENNLFMS